MADLEAPPLRQVEGGFIRGDTEDPKYDAAGEPDWKRLAVALDVELTAVKGELEETRAALQRETARLEEALARADELARQARHAAEAA